MERSFEAILGEPLFADYTRALPGRELVFSAGGFIICKGTTDFFGYVGCPVFLSGQPGVLIALLTGQARVDFAGDAQHQPSSAVVPATGRKIGPPGPIG
ncbi:MAG: hypothetical protein M3Z03_05155 [Actinomycetota bacterium]|nr:hypothetical protein [Actinomycetota bacterium]